MKLSSRHSLSRTALLAVAISAALPAAAAVDLNKRLNVKQDATEVVMGQVMYDYHLGNGFAALNAILTNKAQGRLPEDVTAIEILLGDLYTDIGLPEAADSIFSRIATRNMQSESRAETWFRQGRLKYRQGNMFEAERILNVPIDVLKITPLEAERRVMLGNILMARNEFTLARDILAPVPLNTSLGTYATYNMGVAHLRANQYAEGIRLLETVMNLPVSDNETNALKDRAALAMGYSHLQAKNTEKARDALLHIRLEGPFSNQAMLAMGYVHFLREDYKRALSFWLELMNRNPADSSVQEAMLLAPRAYEELNGIPQAFYGYKLAAQTLRTQMDVLNRISVAIQTPEWLDNLRQSEGRGPDADPLAIPPAVVPIKREETAFLYQLFASHTFNEGYMHYLQLRRLQELMSTQDHTLRVMSEISDAMGPRQSSFPGQARQIEKFEQKILALAEHGEILQRRLRQASRQNTDFATPLNAAQEKRHARIEGMKNAASRLSDTPAGAQTRNRVRLLEGLHLFDIASTTPMSRSQLEKEMQLTTNEIRITRSRVEAIRQLLEDNKRVIATNPKARTTELTRKVEQIRKGMGTSLEEQGAYLRILAETLLEEKRNRLIQDLAEAHLSIARLQDSAMLRDNRQFGTIEKPQP